MALRGRVGNLVAFTASIATAGCLLDGCGRRHGGGADVRETCASGDLDCLLDHFIVEEAGHAVDLDSVSSSVVAALAQPPEAQDVWAVGDAGLILRWSDGAWSSVASGTTAPLQSVWGARADDIWAVGGSNPDAVVLHYDGESWSPVESGATDTLANVFGTQSSDVWAVSLLGAVTHWDGAAWSPAYAAPDALWGLWAANPTEAWAVGTAASAPAGTFSHWDGSSWSETPAGSTGVVMRGVWGSGASDLWAVGDGGTILHSDGGAWSAETSGTAAELVAIHGTGPADVWVAGFDNGDAPRAMLLHRDGGSWAPEWTGVDKGIVSVWAIAPDDAWAVGAALSGADVSSLTVHWDGGSWSEVDAGDGGVLFDVWGATRSDGGAPAISNDPPAITFEPDEPQPLSLEWSDSGAGRPVFCFQLCAPGNCGQPESCTARVACAQGTYDLVASGLAELEMSYAAEVDADVSFDLCVTPVAPMAPGAAVGDAVAITAVGPPGAPGLVGATVAIQQRLAGVVPPGDGDSPYNGTYIGDFTYQWEDRQFDPDVVVATGSDAFTVTIVIDCPVIYDGVSPCFQGTCSCVVTSLRINDPDIQAIFGCTIDGCPVDGTQYFFLPYPPPAVSVGGQGLGMGLTGAVTLDTAAGEGALCVLSEARSMGNCPAFEGHAWRVTDGFFPPQPPGAPPNSTRWVPFGGWTSWTLTKSFGD